MNRAIRTFKLPILIRLLPRDWNGFDIITTPTGDWEWDDLKMHNLTWITNQETRRVSEERD